VQLQTTIGTGVHRASAEIGRLAQLVAILSSRQNVLFAPISALWIWATQWAFAIEAWRTRAGVHIPHWLDTVGEFEALLALGTFAAEHPAFVFPELAATRTSTLEATGLAHPTLPPDAVVNDLALGGDTAAAHLMVVSGSNMSGKSTFLRAIGVNVVLAQMGAPVRATSLRLSPLAVGSTISVHDSLTDGRSRFFAEITRLKQVVDLTRARQGAVLFLLDEILSGTNSHDRRIGAEALLVGLARDGAIGLVTTHDLALGEITAMLPSAVNMHFEDQFEQGGLAFDYRLRPGIVRTSNAIALMRSIGLEV
jgi:DNA mismatch repair ATPase MutS